MSLDQATLHLVAAMMIASMAFGFWRRSYFAAVFMASVLTFIVMAAVMFTKFALGIYHFTP